MYHLQNKFPNKNWKDDYNQNKKVFCFVTFIDNSTIFFLIMIFTLCHGINSEHLFKLNI